MRSLEQERAAFAWERVGGGVAKEYANLAKSLPAMIMGNGLMQTLAFLKGKGSGHHGQLLNHLLEWLADPRAGVLKEEEREFPKAIQALAAMDSPRYQHATSEALAFTRWLRHLAAATQGE